MWINVALSFKFRKYKTAFNNGLKIWLLPDFPAENPLLNGMFCYFCNGLVLHLRHIFKPRNVVCNIFSELTPKASLLFFRKKLIEIVTENLARKLKTEPNFVDKLCAEITFSGKYVVKLKPETKRCVKICFA